jgi:hypothetical protein
MVTGGSVTGSIISCAVTMDYAEFCQSVRADISREKLSVLGRKRKLGQGSPEHGI